MQRLVLDDGFDALQAGQVADGGDGGFDENEAEAVWHARQAATAALFQLAVDGGEGVAGLCGDGRRGGLAAQTGPLSR